MASREGPSTVGVELWYQAIGFRWARNPEAYDAEGTHRFVRYYDSIASLTGVIPAAMRTAGPSVRSAPEAGH